MNKFLLARPVWSEIWIWPTSRKIKCRATKQQKVISQSGDMTCLSLSLSLALSPGCLCKTCPCYSRMVLHFNWLTCASFSHSPRSCVSLWPWQKVVPAENVAHKCLMALFACLKVYNLSVCKKCPQEYTNIYSLHSCTAKHFMLSRWGLNLEAAKRLVQQNAFSSKNSTSISM
jgi:hypothetical protein